MIVYFVRNAGTGNVKIGVTRDLPRIRGEWFRCEGALEQLLERLSSEPGCWDGFVATLPRAARKAKASEGDDDIDFDEDALYERLRRRFGWEAEPDDGTRNTDQGPCVQDGADSGAAHDKPCAGRPGSTEWNA